MQAHRSRMIGGVGVIVGALLSAGIARAQNPIVDFRIIERHTPPITRVTGPDDAVLNFAVQARVTGAPNVGLSQCAFAIIMPNESPAMGTLARNTINTPDGAYFAGPLASTSTSANKVAGAAWAYRYLIGINPQFNGLINQSGGGWVHDANANSIGLVTLATLGPGYLTYTDPDGDGTPDAPLTALNMDWFGANGNWIDLYRFQYTVSNVDVNRDVMVQLLVSAPSVRVFAQSQTFSGMWGPLSQAAPMTCASCLNANFIVSVIGACCDPQTLACSQTSIGGCAAGGGDFRGVEIACSPTVCDRPGACCTGSHCEILASESLCTGDWQGVDTTCGQPANPTTCCVANFDLQGGVAVADVFAFINAWFAGDPRANVTGTGTLSTTDIFAYLNLWFAGCA